MRRPRRVAILGGGIAGLTAAYELSREPELRRRYEVTVYQLGWRLGGKLASGRNPERGWRNEEHGLHVWFGFYENTFALAHEVLERWDAPEGCPIRGVSDIATAHHVAVFGEPRRGEHRFHRLHVPRTRHRPGVSGRALQGPLAGLAGLIDTIRCLPSILSDLAGRPPAGRLPVGLPRAVSERIWPPAEAPRRLSPRFDALADRLGELVAAGSPESRGRAARAAVRACRVARLALAPWFALVPSGLRVRQALYVADLALSLCAAVCSERHPIYLDGDLDRVAHLELGEWLAEHGAHPDTIAHSVFMAAQYDALFQYAGGRRDQPRYEASTACRVLLRGVFGYSGGVSWLLQDGMGEAFIAPLYEVLREQGVRFRFFHEVRRLELDRDGGCLQRIHLARQARVKGDYEPLRAFRGQRVWPTEPDWDQLEDGEELRARGVRFESRFSPPHAEIPVTLERGVDFDEVVSALPLGTLARPDGPAAEWRARKPRVDRAISGINLQASFAAQVWLTRPMADFGWRRRAAAVGWAAPGSVLCDMSPVLAHEGWGADGPVATVYLCGVTTFPETEADSSDREAPERARQAAVDRFRAQLEVHGHEVFAPGGEPFDWRVLYDPEERWGSDRLDAQYIRANIEPWDLCDSAVPGSAPIRLEAHESGLENVALASTWVRTGINSTCVEAAVMSGMAAARALGVEDRPIVGEGFMARPFTPARIPSIQEVFA